MALVSYALHRSLVGDVRDILVGCFCACVCVCAWVCVCVDFRVWFVPRPRQAGRWD